jgi:hypothetical protein
VSHYTSSGSPPSSRLDQETGTCMGNKREERKIQNRMEHDGNGDLFVHLLVQSEWNSEFLRLSHFFTTVLAFDCAIQKKKKKMRTSSSSNTGSIPLFPNKRNGRIEARGIKWCPVCPAPTFDVLALPPLMAFGFYPPQLSSLMDRALPEREREREKSSRESGRGKQSPTQNARRKHACVKIELNNGGSANRWLFRCK